MSSFLKLEEVVFSKIVSSEKYALTTSSPVAPSDVLTETRCNGYNNYGFMCLHASDPRNQEVCVKIYQQVSQDLRLGPKSCRFLLKKMSENQNF